jgi:hypothetical protein
MTMEEAISRWLGQPAEYGGKVGTVTHIYRNFFGVLCAYLSHANGVCSAPIGVLRDPD